MITEIGSRLRITNPSPDMVDWCKKHLEIPNPEYQKKARMNLWLGDTPRTLVMYEVDGDSVIIPFGCLRSIIPLLEGDVKKLFTKQVKVDYKGAKVPLYDYQEEAVGAMIINHYGILQSVERAKQGYMTKEEVDRCYESWKAHVGNESSKKRKSPGRRARRNCHNLIICMDQYYKNLWRESKCLDLSVQENSL